MKMKSTTKSTEQDEEYFSSQETDDVLFQESSERNNGIEKKGEFVWTSCDGVSLCLYLALLAILASPSPCIKVYGYDFDRIVSTLIYSLE